ncbi:hypothetical protein J4403_00380 [Candidatus Woesearchaeota archaeon]|nr:hypothetical protein [Candidatus Woesearchaeota archaeon]
MLIKSSKKGELSLETVIIAIIALIVLITVILIFSKQISNAASSLFGVADQTNSTISNLNIAESIKK